MLFLISIYCTSLFCARIHTLRDGRSRGIYIVVQNKRVQKIGMKNNVREVLYLLHTFCFYENNILYYIAFILFYEHNIFY